MLGMNLSLRLEATATYALSWPHLRDGDGAVPRECADFDGALRANRFYKQAQQLALLRTDLHPRARRHRPHRLCSQLLQHLALMDKQDLVTSSQGVRVRSSLPCSGCRVEVVCS